ncbi:MAG TPA: hypothetical protein VK169_04085 [Saprospiraceae bacterium]|nr:hypothetical protein [Saprospiraceae bacterium]
MKSYRWRLMFGVIFFILSCETTIIAQTTSKEVQINESDVSIVKSMDCIDTSYISELSEIGVFGRKIIYRDLSATKSLSTLSGSIAVKVCINRAGLVTYVELYPDETTITDKQTLKSYLKAARTYKFQPDYTAHKEQCGKLLFNIDN